MEADLFSLVLRCSRNLQTRENVACSSGTAMQAEEKGTQENAVKHSAGTILSSLLIRSAERTEESLMHNSCKDLPRVSSLISL